MRLEPRGVSCSQQMALVKWERSVLPKHREIEHEQGRSTEAYDVWRERRDSFHHQTIQQQKKSHQQR